MEGYTYSKALLIKSYSDIQYLTKNDSIEKKTYGYSMKGFEEELLAKIVEAMDAMCRIIFLESGCTMDRTMHFVYDDSEEQCASAIVAFWGWDGSVPHTIPDAINAVCNLLQYYMVDDDYREDAFYSAIELYDKFNSWFWSTTNLRSTMTEDEAETIREVFIYALPHIKSEDLFLETILKDSIKAGLEVEKDVEKESRLIEEIIRLTEEVKKLSNGVEKIDKKIDEIDHKLDQISNMISIDQSLVTRQLTMADDAEKEMIITAFTDEISQRLNDEFSVQWMKGDYDQEMLLLEDKFGCTWEKMCGDSKKFIVSAKIMYKNQRKLGNIVDYSGVCVLVTKALELEMDRRFYELFMAYMKNHYPGKNNYCKFPPSLLDKYMKPCRQKDYTLGSVPFTLCYRTDGLSAEQIDISKKRLVEFCQAELMKDRTDEEILKLLYDFGKRIEAVRKDYRNPSAHTNTLQAINAKECIDLIVDVEKLLKVMLDSFDK